MNRASVVSPPWRWLRRGTAVVAVLVAALGVPGAAQAAPGTLNGVTPVSGAQLFGVAVQTDGQIVAAGQSAGNIFVQRFTAAGQPNGQYVGPAGVARGVVVEAGGQIVIAGATGGAMFAERLSSALVPDGSFGAGGLATAFGGSQASANAVALGPGGTVVVAGSLNSGGNPAVARFTPAGHLDATLGGSGGIALDWGANSVAQGVAVQPDGRIVLVGKQNPGQPTNAVIARLTPSGSYDTSFAGSGILTYHYTGGGYTALQAVTLQNDNKIVAAGVDSGNSPSCGTCGLGLFFRFNSDGSYDSSFGSGGVSALTAGNDQYALLGAYGVGIAGGGRIVGAGSYADSGTSVDAATWALTTAGAGEAAFGNSGLVRGPSSSFESCAMAVAPDGTIVAAGSTITHQPETTPCSVRAGDGGFVARYEGFGPPPPGPTAVTAPTVSGVAASAITTSTATLSGQVNPGGLPTTYHFEYGTSAAALTSSTPSVSAGSGTSSIAATTALTGLTPGTTYFFRLVAGNSAGTVASSVISFTATPSSGGGGGGGGGAGGTPAGPSATTGPAGRLTASSVKLEGTVNPHGSAATYHFVLGTSTRYGTSTNSTSAGSGSASVIASATVRKLRPATLYHYKLVAIGPGGTASGRDRSFRTAPLAGFVRPPAKISLSGLRRHGLTVRLTCVGTCASTETLSLSASTARHLGLGSRALILGRGSGGSRRGGVFSVHLVVVHGLPSVSRGRSIPATLAASVTVAHHLVKPSKSVALTP